jgi:hypothetical protein
MNIFHAGIASIAILVGSISIAQTTTDTMTFTMAGSQAELVASPTFARAQSR